MNKPFTNLKAETTVNVREIVTPAGLRAWLVEDYAVPIVALEFAMRGGGAQDPPGKAGLATMIAGLMDEGAGDLDDQAFQTALDEKAIELSFHAERDYISGRMRTLSRNLDRAGELMHLAINAPRFDEAPFLRVREQMNARLRHEAHDPAHMAGEAWRARIFAGHPYAQPTEGELETLAAIELSDVKAHARDLITRANVVIAVVGAIAPDRAAELIDKLFSGLPAKGKLVEIAPAPFFGLGDLEVIDLDVPQSTIRFGRPAIARKDPDHMTSIVLAHVLGGGTGLSSRLFREVREKRGLAYSVSASVATFAHGCYLYGGTTTKNERAHESLEVIRSEILDMAQGNINEAELDKGRKYLIGSYPLRFDTSTKIASQLVHIQLDGYGVGWLTERNRLIAAVTMADAKRVAERLFGDGSLSVTMVGRPEKG
jgi:zinc protease